MSVATDPGLVGSSDAFSAERSIFCSEASSALAPGLTLAEISGTASFGTELPAVSGVAAALAAGTAPGISSAELAFGHAMSEIRSPASASALIMIKKVRFMFFAFAFFIS